MPWNEVSAMSLRLEFVHLASQEGANVRQLCRRFEVSAKTGYKWLARFHADGPGGLADRSRRPTHSPSRTSEALEQEILKLRSQHRAWGGRKLRARLQTLGTADVPSASTITAILRRCDALDSGPTDSPHACQRFEQDAPNRLWQMDFKGHFALERGRCHPLTVLDDHSRFALGLFACADERGETVQTHLTTLFRRYGLPERILCDNGSPWGAGSESPHTRLTVWLLRLGIGVGHGRPYHPQTQGKEERFHRTLNAEVLQGQTFRDLEISQRRFDVWRPVYNHERPHESLDMAVPASRYQPSPRVYSESPPELVYGEGDLVRKVQSRGVICFRGREWPISQAFRGQAVALRATTTDGLWLVYFGVHRIATIDLRDNKESR
jgi:transposase InsO family protein